MAIKKQPTPPKKVAPVKSKPVAKAPAKPMASAKKSPSYTKKDSVEYERLSDRRHSNLMTITPENYGAVNYRDMLKADSMEKNAYGAYLRNERNKLKSKAAPAKAKPAMKAPTKPTAKKKGR
jgi:hypothetical protein